MTRSAFVVLGLVALAACSKPVPTPPAEKPTPPTNRIATPEAVRKNLGIAFVKVERRRVARTLRFPGHFELLPTGLQELRTPVQGRVTVLVRPLQTVAAGDLVATVDSPTWRQAQRDLGEIEVQTRVLAARIAAMQPLATAHRAHETSLRDAITVLEARERNVLETQGSVGGQARELSDVRAQLAQARAQHAEAEEKTAETGATIAELQANLAAAHDRMALGLDAAAAVLGTTREALTKTTADGPVWRQLRSVELRAVAAATIDAIPLATGAWVEPGELVARATDRTQLRFRARGLQGDLAQLRDGLPASAIPATGPAATVTVAGRLLLGANADPTLRTIDLFLEPANLADWARPGVAGFLEVEAAGTDAPALAIPTSATLQDGLQRVFFRRDPADADKVIRVDADLGLDDGRWVEVRSGVMDGDEVVLAGAYELMLASSGSAAKGGHFHADGTWHEGEHK